jgi:hypothetical protein
MLALVVVQRPEEHYRAFSMISTTLVGAPYEYHCQRFRSPRFALLVEQCELVQMVAMVLLGRP